VVKEEEYVFGKRGFVKKSNFDGIIYRDIHQESFRAFGHEQRVVGGFTKYRFWKNLKRSKAEGFFPKDSTLSGDSLVTGGVLCVGAGDRGILYEHKELVWGDRADLEEMKRRCQGAGNPPAKL